MKYIISFMMIMSLMLPWYLWAADAKSEEEFSLKGYASSQYVSRETRLGNEKFNDNDVFGQLRLDMKMPDNQYEMHFFGTARADLNEEEDKEFSVFEDIGDTGKMRQKGYLYEAHFDINRALPNFDQIRIGRQSSRRDGTYYFDGMAADIVMSRKLDLVVYGGRTVHFYEVDPDSDSLGGVGLDFSATKQTSASLDYLSVKDVRSDLSDRQDDLVSVKLRQRLSRSVKGALKYRWINSEPRDVRVNSLILLSEMRTGLNVSYFKQFLVQNELSDAFALFHDVLGQSQPFQIVDIKIQQPIGSHYSLDVGYTKRDLLEQKDEGSFNREYKRTFAIFGMYDRIFPGVSLTLIGEQWESKTKVNSTGWDLGYRFKESLKKAKVNAGSYYSLYKYDYFSERGETTDVQTYYVKGQVPLGQSFTLRGSYEREESLDDYNIFKLGVRYDF